MAESTFVGLVTEDGAKLILDYPKAFKAGPRGHYRQKDTLLERFWSQVAKSDGCWLWQGSRQRLGYGVFSYARRWAFAHRLSWMVHGGTIPEGLCICHRCDNPRCVRPDHLFLGTQADNMRDKVSKGRQSRGTRIGNARLTNDIVQEIRARVLQGEPGVQIARSLSISKSTVSMVANRHIWRHVP